MNERLAQIRAALGISQEEMGRRIGVSRFCISNYEAGTRGINERAARQICQEFGVDPGWLATGEGQMFVEENDVLETIDRVMSGEDEFAKRVFRGFAKFSTDDWRKLEDVLNKFLEGYSQEEVADYVRQQDGLADAQAEEKPDR